MPAITTGDATLLPAISDGARLHDITALIETSNTGSRVVPTYTFDDLALTIVFPGGLQRGPNAGMRARGTVEEVTLSATGDVIDQTRKPFATTFSLGLTTSGMWLTTATLPYDFQRSGS